MSIQIGICQANPISVEVCQVEIVNTVEEIFTLEYEEIDSQNTLILETVNFDSKFEILAINFLYRKSRQHVTNCHLHKFTNNYGLTQIERLKP